MGHQCWGAHLSLGAGCIFQSLDPRINGANTSIDGDEGGRRRGKESTLVLCFCVRWAGRVFLSGSPLGWWGCGSPGVL